MDTNGQYPHYGDIPMGLGMALMQNKPAMDYFAALSDEGRRMVIDHTHVIRSKEEMQDYVDALGKNDGIMG
ncbi:MAG: hypothetical protein FWF44_04740 [Defluviitaleaceae bacterium]|nr:hypothetical protein [Defluviitaleaceae bacterium]